MFAPSNGVDKLYAQLLAAKLAIANGADAYLATHNSTSWATASSTEQAQVNAWATTLNNDTTGIIGPGHCSE